jgi:hypothetical protein
VAIPGGYHVDDAYHAWQSLIAGVLVAGVRLRLLPSPSTAPTSSAAEGNSDGSLALSPGDPVPPSSFAHLFRLLQQTMGKGGSSNCSLRVDNLAGAALASSMHIKQTGHIRKTYRKNDGAVIGWGGRQHLGRILFVRALSQREPAIDVIRRAVNAPPLRCLAQHGLS